jgi:hypothetical protein
MPVRDEPPASLSGDLFSRTVVGMKRAEEDFVYAVPETVVEAVEPIAEATTMRVVDQEIFHDSDHLSALVLPIMP